MALKIKFEDNSGKVISELKDRILRILEKWGILVEGYAVDGCPVGTVESTGKKGYRGGTLKGSITHEVNESEKSVSIGTNVEYGPYVELGTGPYFEPPPDWETFTTKRGSGKGKGYVHARPFLRPAVEDHIGELKDIMQDELEET